MRLQAPSRDRDKRGRLRRICLSPRVVTVEVEGSWMGLVGGGAGSSAGGVASASVLLPASQVLQDAVDLFLFTQSLEERQQVQ